MTHPNREELAGRPANDEAGLFYDLDDMAGHITLKVDHQSFAIGPEFEDTPDGKLEREWFKCMIHLAMRRVIEKALAAAALRQSPSVEEVARVICAHEVGGFCQNIGGDLGCTVGRGASPCGSRCIATDAQLHLSGRMQTAQAIIQLFQGRGGG